MKPNATLQYPIDHTPAPGASLEVAPGVRWLRMRLRAMKRKRKSKMDNWRIRVAHLRNMGFIFLRDLAPNC